MSFFNLTALGPQSPFEAALKSDEKTLLHIFEEDDIRTAFESIDEQKIGKFHNTELDKYLISLYRGPVPDYLHEEQILRKLVTKEGDEYISWVSWQF